MRRQPQTRGGRLARRGVRMIWIGLLVIPVGLILAAVNAPRAVLIAAVVVLLGIAFAGAGLTLYATTVLNKEIRDAPDEAADSGARQPQPGNRGTRS